MNINSWKKKKMNEIENEQFDTIECNQEWDEYEYEY